MLVQKNCFCQHTLNDGIITVSRITRYPIITWLWKKILCLERNFHTVRNHQNEMWACKLLARQILSTYNSETLTMWRQSFCYIR